MRRAGFIIAPLALLGLQACSDNMPKSDMRAGEEVAGNGTIASAISGDPELRSLKAAMTDTQLAPVLDGKGDYTLLAPSDAAFAALGEKAKELSSKDNQPLMVAILRGHILPGQVTAENIAKAIERKKGPVEMMSMSGAPVTFTKNGDAIMVGNGATQARLADSVTKASNGAVVHIDKVLLPKG